MKTIPEQFKSKGFLHSQIWRDGMVCVYERQSVTGTAIHYETVVLKADKGGKILSEDPKTGNVAEYTIEAGERYPSSEAWGTRGWTYQDKYDALSKARQITANLP